MPRTPSPRILFLNAALAGANGNTAVFLESLRRRLGTRAQSVVAVLADGLTFKALEQEIAQAHALVIGTGTHWDSWSSLLQRFFEEATESEGTKTWLGKPVACVVTEHSVGGKGVLARLQSVLVTYGCLIPPMSGLVLSRAVQIAGKGDPKAASDFWCPEDLDVLADNLLNSLASRPKWKTWPVDRTEFAAKWAKL